MTNEGAESVEQRTMKPAAQRLALVLNPSGLMKRTTPYVNFASIVSKHDHRYHSLFHRRTTGTNSVSGDWTVIFAWVVAYCLLSAAVFSDQLFLRIAALVNTFLVGWLVILAATAR